ncbi:MAG: hypothetical protein ACK5VW_01245 [Holosporales bacterium]
MEKKVITVLAHLLETKGEPNYKRCGLSYDSFWRVIRNFERELGFILVKRKDSFFTLTPAGKIYAHKAREILRLIKIAKRDAEIVAASDESMIPLVIATTRPLSSAWVLPAIKTYQKDQKGEVAIFNDDYLTPSQTKIADIFVRPMPEHASIQSLWKVRHEYGLFASHNYLEESGVPQTVHDLIHHRIIGYGETLFTGLNELDWHLKGTWCDLPPLTPYLRTNSTSETAKAAQLGLGICTFPTESVKIYNMDLVRILPEVIGPIYYTTIGITRDLPDSKKEAALTLCELIKTEAEKKGITIDRAS